MTTKKSILYFLTTFIVVLFILSICFYLKKPVKNSENITNPGFATVREYNQILGIFQNGSREPVATINIDVNSMRSVDREMFLKGITVYSREELTQLIEDFSS